MEDLKNDFLNPGSEYTLMPFWFLNGKLKKGEIKQKLADFKSKGVDGFVIHPRIGLPDELTYMGEKFIDFVKYIVREAASLNMRVVLYDEGMYPSGSANGQVVKSNSAFAARCLRMSSYDVHGTTLLIEPHKDYEKCELVAAVKKAQNGELYLNSAIELAITDGIVKFTPPDDGEWTVIFLVSGYSGGTIRGIHFCEDDGEANAPKGC